MSDGIMLVFGEDGVAREYDDTWDITIHCESEEEQKAVWEKLNNLNREVKNLTDTISRQAAIDAFGEKPLAWTEGEYELGLQNQWQSDVDALKAVPSAQPENVKCKKCRYVYYDKEFGNYWCNRKPDSFMVEEDGYCKWGK